MLLIKKSISFIVVFLLTTYTATAQNVFNKRFTTGPLTLEVGGNLKIINDTIFVVYANTIVGGDWNIQYHKLDKFGNTIVRKEISQTGIDYYTQNTSNSILDFGDSIIHVADCRVNNKSETFVACLDKYTLDTLWSKRLGDYSTYYYSLLDIYRVEDSLVLLGASNKLNPLATSGGDVVIIKCDLNFNVGWEKIHGGNMTEDLYGSLQTTDGGFFASGVTKSNAPGNNWDGFAYKLDSLGNLEWTYQDYGIYADHQVQVIEISDGYLITGVITDSVYEWSTNNFYNYGKLYVKKLDFTGTELWSKKYTFPGGYDILTGAWRIRKTQDNNFVILACHGRNNANIGVGALMKINEFGDSLWYREYQGLLNPETKNYMRDVRQHPDGGYVMTGFVAPVGGLDTGYQDMWLVKANCLGFDKLPQAAGTWYANDNYEVILDNNSQYFGNCIINWGDQNSSYIYEGYDTLISHTYADDNAYDIEIIALACGDADTSIVTVFPQLSGVVEWENLELSLYPNPASKSAQLKIANAALQIQEVSVYSLQGKLIQNTTNINQSQFLINTDNLSSGTYLVNSLLSNGERFTLKLNVVE